MPRRITAAALSFLALLIVVWFVGQELGAAGRLGRDAIPVFLSLAVLLAPYWLFGFGLADSLRHQLITPVTRVFASLLLVLPYPLFAVPAGQFRWSLCLGMLAVVLAVTSLLETARSHPPGWRDWTALVLLALSVELHYFDGAWPPGLNALPKLLFVNLGLYAYLVVRPIGGVGYDFSPTWPDLRIGLREFAFYTPLALALGLATQFLHIHRTLPSPLHAAAAWLFTLFFIAVPEELFFRGLLLNMLERRLGTRWALAISALLFGLSHFNKRAAFFNWRYVILAAIAGVFYGRAWLAQRRILASSVTHATVDTVWSIWLR